jgi:hypothetical protein
MHDDEFVADFAAQLATLPGVRAVALGGTRALGTAGPGADWDFALYYRGTFDADAVRAQGWDGDVANPGEWGGGIMNGGAWLEVDGRRVDLIYRDLDEVEHWWAEARDGRFQKQLLMFYLAGIPTYVVVAELAINRVLHGELPRPEYPDALRATATERWHRDALMTLDYAQRAYDNRGDAVVAGGNLARAIIEESHSRLAARREWVLNEKGIAARAGLDAIVARDRPLHDALAAARAELTAG